MHRRESTRFRIAYKHRNAVSGLYSNEEAFQIRNYRVCAVFRRDDSAEIRGGVLKVTVSRPRVL